MASWGIARVYVMPIRRSRFGGLFVMVGVPLL